MSNCSGFVVSFCWLLFSPQFLENGEVLNRVIHNIASLAVLPFKSTRPVFLVSFKKAMQQGNSFTPRLTAVGHSVLSSELALHKHFITTPILVYIT